MYGGWAQALTAAGFNPDKIVRKKQDPNKTKGRVYTKYETQEEVIAGIKKRVKQKKALSTRELQGGDDDVRDFALWKAGQTLFESWANALEAAGVDLSTVFPEWQIRRMETFHDKRSKSEN